MSLYSDMRSNFFDCSRTNSGDLYMTTKVLAEYASNRKSTDFRSDSRPAALPHVCRSSLHVCCASSLSNQRSLIFEMSDVQDHIVLSKTDL